MANTTLTVSLEESTLRGLARLAAREQKDIATLIRDCLSALVKDAAGAEHAAASESRPAALEAKPFPGTDRQRGSYGMEILAKSDTVRMVAITIPPGGCVPWHYHSQVTDTFFCLEQAVVIETKAPDERVELRPGQTHIVEPRRPHRVSSASDGQCKFALLQGMGTYDFVPL